MGLGIIDPGTDNVPGTVAILDRDSDATGHDPQNSSLKFDRTGDRPILLVPQPSDDPNDPLNWSLRRRDLILLALCSISVVATTLSPILAADSLQLALHYKLNFTEIALLTGYHLLGVGVGGFLFVPSARVWGKRHLYLLGTIIVCFSSAWGGASKHSYHSLLWSRIFQGIGLAPFEALVNASVGDMYFLHERGKRMALVTVALFGAAFFAPVIIGKIADTIGWEWSFYFVAIFSGCLFPVVFFFVPETAFVRSAQLNTDFGESGTRYAEKTQHRVSEESQEFGNGETEKGTATASVGQPHHSSGARSTPATVSYARTLLPFNGRKTDESYIKLLFRPLPLFLHPGILWACLTQGCMIGWTVNVGVVLSAILYPYFFSDAKVGYMYTSAFIGAFLAFILCGLVSDPMARLLTKWNGGVYEPEFRILIVIPQLIFGCLGLYGFGWTMEEVYHIGPIIPDVFLGFILAGMVCGAVGAALYLVDAHREIAIEAFTCMMIFKNVFSFAITFRAYDWIIELGSKRVFIIIGSVQVGICVLAWAMYVFGKVNRAFFAKHDILALLRLR